MTKPHAVRRLLAALGRAPEPPPEAGARRPDPRAIAPRVPGLRRAEPIPGVAVAGGQAEREYVLA